MSPEKFIELVKKMRASQKGFFATDKNSSEHYVHLKESKALEKLVDDQIKKYESNQLPLL